VRNASENEEEKKRFLGLPKNRRRHSLGREERNENGTRGVFLEAHVFNSSTSTWATRAKLVSRTSIFTNGRTTGMGKQSEG
jgi:hypothetical protein